MGSSEDKDKRYVVLFDDTSKKDIKVAQSALDLKLTSSIELNSEVRAHDILNSGSGIFLKNLGIAVINNIEKDKLTRSANSNKNIIHWEEDKIFRPVTEFQLIDELKQMSASMQQKIEVLEQVLKQREIEEDWENVSWGIDAIGLRSNKFTGKGIDLAILDTGFFLEHPDFQGRSIVGKSFIENESWHLDKNGHGTHCAGVAAGFRSLDTGTRYGVAPQVNLGVGKVLSDNGNGSTSGILDAIDWALEKQYMIISMSLGSPVNIGDPPSQIFEHTGRRALEQNCLLIAAAGNGSNRPNVPRPVSNPANALSIMAVASINKELQVSTFSNGGINAADGGMIDICAPGEDIFSSFSPNARNGRLYSRLNGTSMATPYVSGLAALYWEAFPQLTALEIWKKLEENAKKLPNQLVRDIGKGIAQAV